MPDSAQPDHSLGSASAKERQIEEAMEQYLALLESGSPPDRNAFLARFPQIADELDGQLEAIELLQVASPQIVAAGETPLDSGEFADRSQLGDFLLLRPIGRGGMGVVYKAIQLSLDRTVAVKVLPFASLLNPKQRQRFQNEARAAATLEHPNIVPILFTGVERGVHFYAMQLIEGQSLAEVIQSMHFLEAQLDNPTRRLPIGDAASGADKPLQYPADAETKDDVCSAVDSHAAAEMISGTVNSHAPAAFYQSVARLGAQAAEALQYAHEHGVVHRDIKPGNLLVDETGKLWITDFGLARYERNDTITMEGDVFGTLAYMSPEQRSGSQLADARSDVYSLGATLYELVSLTQPFSDQVQADFAGGIQLEPTPLRKLVRKVPIDLQTIINKSMASQSQDRYQTAGALAEDLQRFCSGRTIQARPPTAMDRLVKWTLRHRSIAAAGVLGIAAVGFVFAVATVLVFRAQRNTQQALSESERRADQVADLLYVSDIQLAYRAWNSNRPEHVREILDRHRPQAEEVDRRGLEWQLLNSLTSQPKPTDVGSHAGGVNQIAVFPDGRRIASVGADKMLRLWDLQTGASSAAIPLADTSVEMPCSVAVSPDGTTVATGSDTVLLWDADSGQLIKELTKFDYNVQSIAYSPDGTLIACGSRYDRVRVFDAGGALVHEIEDSSRHESLAFTPDGQQLIVPSRRVIPGLQAKDGFIRVWNTDRFRGRRDLLTGRRDELHNFTLATCAPDGGFLVACEQAGHVSAKIIDPESGDVLLELPQSRDQVNALAISDDSQTVAVAYSDGTIGYWDLGKDESGRLFPPIRQSILVAHQGKIQSIKFVGSDRLVSCGADGKIKAWALPEVGNPLSTTDRNTRSSMIVIDRVGNSIAYLSTHRTLRLLSPEGVVAAEHAVGDNMDRFACSADFCRFASWSSQDDCVEIRSFSTGTVEQRVTVQSIPLCVCFSPDDRQLAILDDRGELTVWDLHARRIVAERSIDGAEDGSVYRCRYTSDGERLLCASDTRGIDILQTSDFQLIQHEPMLSTILRTAFTDDGSVLATAHDDGVIRLWNWPQIVAIGEFRGHEAPVDDLSFYGNNRLLSISRDGTLRIWSLAHGRSLGIVEDLNDRGICVAASQAGKIVCAGFLNDLQSLVIYRVTDKPESTKNQTTSGANR